MVFSTQAREDVDNYLLTKTITYYEYDETITDLAYEARSRTHTNTYSIKAQATVQVLNRKYADMGIQADTVLVGLFRYEYSQESDGTTIDPVLVPKKSDEIVFLNRILVA